MKFYSEFSSVKFSIGRQEKMISGMYLGELARLVIQKFTKSGHLFKGKGSDLLFQRWKFFTKYVSEIESDNPGVFTNCREVLEELGLGHATDVDCANVRYICECVSRRAAHLVSAGIAALINKMGEPIVTVSSYFKIISLKIRETYHSLHSRNSVKISHGKIFLYDIFF